MDTTEFDKLTKLVNEKKAAREFQLRKHSDWNENYELYRDKVRTNRLTQRQAVNIPMMKETIKTLLSKVDDAPSVDWNEKSGDEMKEIIYQEIWNDFFKSNDLVLKDILDKKNVFLYGLSTKFLNLGKNRIDISILDTYDVVFDPKMDPLDVESARFIIRQNIFRTLREVLVSDRYTEKAKEELKIWADSDKGILQSGKNKEAWEKKQERLKAMGLSDEKFKYYAGGDVIVNITEQYTELWNEKEKRFKRHVVVYADDSIELCDDLLIDCIGIDQWPFEVWSEDPETNDIYPDSVADMIRVPNKVMNVWYSQMIENRTLQNFQMHWFDSSQQGYSPQTYEPGPGRMLPAPGNPKDTIMPVQVNGLDETLTALDYLTNIIERGTGATALEKGTPEQGVQTLGEVQILVGKAGERAKTMAKFYHNSWYRFAKKWDAMMQANSFKKMTLYKTGIDGKMYEKVVYNADWKSKAGYEPVVASSSEQEADDVKSMQKFGYVIQQNPNNIALKKIVQQRQLKLLDLTPAELKEVEDEEDKMQQMAQQQMMQAQPAPQQAQPSPVQPQQAPVDLSAEISQLGQLMK
jgi:hypothetical protein